ncbi:MAG: hypothetical protein QOH17_421, partial [Pseudonocardiales bacterium]|nr:hypothetical protein [Pseudonocardiales bacterium]
HATEIATVGVGYDGSVESKDALAFARDLAAQHHASLRALRVVTIPSSPYVGYAGVALPDLIETMMAQATDDLSELDGVEGEARIGAVGDELSAFAETVDVLVIGSRGYGALRRLMLGSTAHYLTGHARCPVVVLPRGRRDAAEDHQSNGDRDAATVHATS